MLSEKEIEEILEQHIFWDEEAHYHGVEPRPQFFTEQAAHAIHERMREGLVWETEGVTVCGVYGCHCYVEIGSAVEQNLDGLNLPNGVGSDGQRVRVYVVREEDD